MKRFIVLLVAVLQTQIPLSCTQQLSLHWPKALSSRASKDSQLTDDAIAFTFSSSCPFQPPKLFSIKVSAL